MNKAGSECEPKTFRCCILDWVYLDGPRLLRLAKPPMPPKQKFNLETCLVRPTFEANWSTSHSKARDIENQWSSQRFPPRNDNFKQKEILLFRDPGSQHSLRSLRTTSQRTIRALATSRGRPVGTSSISWSWWHVSLAGLEKQHFLHHFKGWNWILPSWHVLRKAPTQHVSYNVLIFFRLIPVSHLTSRQPFQFPSKSIERKVAFSLMDGLVGMVENLRSHSLHLPTAIGDGGGKHEKKTFSEFKNDLRTHLFWPFRSEEHGMLTVWHPATKVTTAT